MPAGQAATETIDKPSWIPDRVDLGADGRQFVRRQLQGWKREWMTLFACLRPELLPLLERKRLTSHNLQECQVCVQVYACHCLNRIGRSAREDHVAAFSSLNDVVVRDDYPILGNHEPRSLLY